MGSSPSIMRQWRERQRRERRATAAAAEHRSSRDSPLLSSPMPKPLPPEILKALHAPESMRGLAEQLGQFEDDKAWKHREQRRRTGVRGNQDATPSARGRFAAIRRAFGRAKPPR